MLTPAKSRVAIEKIIDLYPNAVGSLTARSPFEIVVAVLLSAQATDVSVNKATPALFERFPDPAALAAATPAEVEPYIKQIGLYHNKAKYLVALGQKLQTDFGGVVPHTMTELTQLPGVGRKSASVVLGDAFGIPAFAVDTHVSRIAKRLQIAAEKASVRQVETAITTALPEAEWIHGHHAMINFGRDICHAQKPACQTCPLLPMCVFGQEYVQTH
ncbi:endonuclease III [Lapidilactobacillus wuchangensis]|uniref:endonuclease III n=1 Tax=Lapidilactobacillus wuchangensis TaxID=2486001 RepID=UPI000F7AB0F8|nr:endonuclease III [Lapidilactobacillus wuchangensis]